MTIQTIPVIGIPDWRLTFANSTVISGTLAGVLTLDGASDALAWVGDPPATGNLTEFYIRSGTVSVTSGPLNFDGRIEQLTNGRPNGTLHAANTNGAVSVADTDDNVWKTCTLTAAASVTKGTPIGIVFKAPSSGTFSFVAAGLSSVVYAGPANFPVVVLDSNGDGTYDANLLANALCLMVKIGGVVYSMSGTCPWDSFTYANYNSGSSPDEKALSWSWPVAVRCFGMRAFVGNVAAGGDFTFNAWPDSASAQTDADLLAQVSTDGDVVPVNTQDSWVTRFWSSPITLNANTIYWFGVRADTANNIALGIMGTPSGITGSHAATPGGTNLTYGTRAWSAGSANAFTPDANTQPLIQLLIDGIHDGSGGGGGQRVIGG